MSQSLLGFHRFYRNLITWPLLALSLPRSPRKTCHYRTSLDGDITDWCVLCGWVYRPLSYPHFYFFSFRPVWQILWSPCRSIFAVLTSFCEVSMCYMMFPCLISRQIDLISNTTLQMVESLNLILKDSVQVSPSRVFQALHLFCRGKGNISESHSVSGPLQINFNLNVWHVSSGKKHFDRSCERTDWEERFSFS